jgi:hypothetical protein
MSTDWSTSVPSPNPRSVGEPPVEVVAPIAATLAVELLAKHSLDVATFTCVGCGWPYEPSVDDGDDNSDDATAIAAGHCWEGPCPLGQFATELWWGSLNWTPRPAVVPEPRQPAPLATRQAQRQHRQILFSGPVPGGPVGATITVQRAASA